MSTAWASRAVAAWLQGVTRLHWLVAAAVLGLAAGALWLAGEQLRIDTRTEALLDPDLPFQQTHARYQDAFPQYHDTIVAVVQGATPEQAAADAQRLAAALAAESDHVQGVFRPRGGAFFEQNGLLYRSVDALEALADRLAEAQPLLARIQREPSLLGLFDTLTRAVGEDAELLGPIADPLAAALGASAQGERPAPVSWQANLGGQALGAGDDTLALVVVQPVLDFSRINTGAGAVDAARRIIAETPLAEGTQVRLTGSIPLRVEELRNALSGAQLAGSLALVFVTLVLALALRAPSLIAVTLVVLGAGLALSAGAATLLVGRINLISIAFAVLYIGLGVNYAIHYLLRYREALGRIPAGQAARRRSAIVEAGQRLGGPLVLCTVTTAIGFFAFLPTAYAGVAELGLIAGTSMFITLAVTYTLLPALLALLPAPRTVAGGERAPGRVLREWPWRHPRPVLVAAGVLGLSAALVATQVRFDDDPLNLRNPNAESVQTLRVLLEGRATDSRNLVALVADRARLERLGAELEALDTVARTVDLFDLVPAEQATKRAILSDIEFLLGPTLVGEPIRLAAADPAAVREAAQALRAELADDRDHAPAGLAVALEHWLAATAELAPQALAERVATLQQAVLGTLPLAYDRLIAALGAERVTLDTLPEGLRARFVAPDGTYLLQIEPAGDMTDPDARARFVASVQAVIPDVAGSPVRQLASGEAIVTSFQTALVAATGGIALVLLLVLRRLGLALRILVPLLLGGVLTLATLVLLGIPFNFANVIALPLLLGIGVDNGVHMAMRLREDAGSERAGSERSGPAESAALHGSTARAILFGSLTTIVSFGNLALSPHLGTATLGVALALGMLWILLATFVVLPALIRPRPGDTR